jgi:hypothetical protein
MIKAVDLMCSMIRIQGQLDMFDRLIGGNRPLAAFASLPPRIVTTEIALRE